MANDNWVKVLEKAGQKEAKRLAKDAQKKLYDEYEYVLQSFYNEYDPQYYIRHKGGGLYESVAPYYKNPHNATYRGGIRIFSDRMFDDYHDPKNKVLNSFLLGYHGRKELGIYSKINPLKHMYAYKNMLINHYKNLKN